MKGIVRFKVIDNDIVYDLRLERNITVIAGVSATGKTTLCRKVLSYGGRNPSVQIVSDYKVICLTERTWRSDIHEANSVFICDENEDFTYTNEFSDAFYESGSYLLMIGREPHSNLAYSVNSIVELVEVDGVHILKKLYDVGENGVLNYKDTCELIVTEDKKAGYQFMKTYTTVSCETAEGNANVYSCIPSNVATVAFVDGAAFGPYVEELLQLANCTIYAPESFGWLLLKSGEFGDVEDILANPADYIEAKEHRSWERFFAHKCKELGHYSKDKLPTKMNHVAVINAVNPLVRKYLDANKVVTVDWELELERVKSMPDEFVTSIKTSEELFARLKDTRLKWITYIPDATIAMCTTSQELYETLLRFKPRS